MFYVWTACLPTYASLTVDLAPKLGLTSGVIALTWFPWYIALGSTLVHLALPETARRPLR
ncbi:hypothetical protein LUW74_01225 [Actinomadura madurae]|uniref:hypothetical protein n=1 Tax=Actinomadura madurae TaxID=1993 RepID=UPI002025E202|nr:hypothetical protein [Actinomadura madurae]URN02139.1 hypothetical protein LUW74_01225 [Actinomadura madurae]